MVKKDEYAIELDAIKAVLEALAGLEQGQQRFVLKTVFDRLGLEDLSPVRTPATSNFSPSDSGSRSEGSASTIPAPPRTPQEFLRAKRPANESQRVAVLGYYLTHFEDQPEFKAAQLADLNTRARGVPLSNPRRAVDNATRRDRVLAPAREGKKQVSSHGEELVEALPNQERVKAVIDDFRLTVARSGRHRRKRRKNSSE
jgi:hypothetical protein